jgi:hypothetical protein
MIRELRARLESETGDSISLVSHDEQADRPSPARNRPTGRRTPNPLLEEDSSSASADELEASAVDEAADPDAGAAAGMRAVRRAAHHPLDDDDSPGPANPSPVRSRQAPGANAVQKPAAHVLDEASARPGWTGDKDGAQTFTIQLSKSVFDGS